MRLRIRHEAAQARRRRVERHDVGAQRHQTFVNLCIGG